MFHVERWNVSRGTLGNFNNVSRGTLFVVGKTAPVKYYGSNFDRQISPIPYTCNFTKLPAPPARGLRLDGLRLAPQLSPRSSASPSPSGIRRGKTTPIQTPPARSPPPAPPLGTLGFACESLGAPRAPRPRPPLRLRLRFGRLVAISKIICIFATF